MNRVLCLAIVTFASFVFTQNAGSQTKRLGELERLAFLVGGTWTAEGTIPGFGSYTAVRTYRWSLDSAFIEQSHEMTFARGRVTAESFLGWDPVQGKVVGYGFGNDGGIATTSATFTNSTFIFEGERRGGFNPGKLHGVFTIHSKNDIIEEVKMLKEGAWIPAFAFRWRRAE